MSNGSDPLPTRLTEARQAVLLRRLVRRTPDPDAWKKLSELAQEDLGKQAAPYLAKILALALESLPSSKQLAISNPLGRLLAGQQNISLTENLASQTIPEGRQLALSIMDKWPKALPDGLFRHLDTLLSDRQIPTSSKINSLVSVTHSLGPENQKLGLLYGSFIRGRSKKRSIKYLKKLKDLTGRNAQLENLLQEVEGLVRMDCPRCGVQLRQREMIDHLWTEHELILDGHRVRDPWSVIEEKIEEFRKEGQSDLLDQCRQLASRLDSGKSLVRFERYLIKQEIEPEAGKKRLIQLAETMHAAICPWCLAVEPQPADLAPAMVYMREGLLTSEGFLVDLSEKGWQTALTIRTNDRVIYQGTEPNWPWTGRGLATWISLAFVLIALFCSVGYQQVPKKPLILVLALLGVALIVWDWLPVVWQKMRRSLPERTCYYAWTILVPDLIQNGIHHQESALISGMTINPLTLGLVNVRRKFFPSIIKAFEIGVKGGEIPSRHLAILRRQQVNDAVIQGVDPINLVVYLVSSCFEGKLPMRFAEELLNGWETNWWTPGNLERFRVLLCNQAFEIGYEVRNLVDLGQTVPSLATILKTNNQRHLAGLRLLWSQRSAVPWERCGTVRTVFDLAKDPQSSEVLRHSPDLLLFQEETDWPQVRQRNDEPFQPIRILLCCSGLICQDSRFEQMPHEMDMISRWRYHELKVDDQIFFSRKSLELLEKRLEQWFRFAFLEFYPRVAEVKNWSAPDRSMLFRSWGARECQECHHYYIARVGQLGIAQRDDAPVAQVVSYKKQYP